MITDNSKMHFLESDNIGSTDSEVKRILSLHMPIREYEDESDSDKDTPKSRHHDRKSKSCDLSYRNGRIKGKFKHCDF